MTLSVFSMDLKVLPHRPSVYSLAGAKSSYNEIVNLGPKVSEEYLEAVKPILSSGGQTMKNGIS